MDRRRRVYLEWDYAMDPICEEFVEGVHGPPLDVLIPEALRAEIRRWSRNFDSIADGATPDETEAFLREGRSLRTRLAEALGPTFVVGIYNEESAEIEWPEQ